MSELVDGLRSLKSNVKQLISENRTLNSRNNKLKDQSSELLINSEKLQDTINQLESQIKTIKISKSVNNTKEESVELKLRINELVRDVNKCIALLNR